MLDKLEAIKARFDELGVALTNPEVVNDNKRFSQTSKEYRSLERIVVAHQRYLRLMDDIAFNKEALLGDDAELKELAKAETAGLEEQKAAMEKEIRNLLIPKDLGHNSIAIVESKLSEYRRKVGDKAFFVAMSGGQYSHPDGFFFGGGRDEEGRPVNPLVGIAAMILAPLGASLVQMAISRSREYEADRAGAEIPGEHLAAVQIVEEHREAATALEGGGQRDRAEHQELRQRSNDEEGVRLVGYNLSLNVTVTSPEVERIAALDQQTAKLVEQGVQFTTMPNLRARKPAMSKLAFSQSLLR